MTDVLKLRHQCSEVKLDLHPGVGFYSVRTSRTAASWTTHIVLVERFEHRPRQVTIPSQADLILSVAAAQESFEYLTRFRHWHLVDAFTRLANLKHVRKHPRLVSQLGLLKLKLHPTATNQVQSSISTRRIMIEGSEVRLTRRRLGSDHPGLS